MTTEIFREDSRITCKECKKVADGPPEELAGNPVGNFMGHAMVYLRDGRTALCLWESRLGPITQRTRGNS